MSDQSNGRKYIVGASENRAVLTPRDKDGHRDDIVFCGTFPLEEAQENALFIADALNVTAETGLTPREMAEKRAELLWALEWVLDSLGALGGGKHNLYDYGITEAEADRMLAAIAKVKGESK